MFTLCVFKNTLFQGQSTDSSAFFIRTQLLVVENEITKVSFSKL